MNGYFSQLMRQTGIAVAGRTSTWQGANPERQMSSDGEGTAGLEVEEFQPAAPVESVEEMQTVASESALPSDSTLAEPTITNSPEVPGKVPSQTELSRPLPFPEPLSPTTPVSEVPQPSLLEVVEQVSLTSDTVPPSDPVFPRPSEAVQNPTVHRTPSSPLSPSPLEQEAQVEVPTPPMEPPHTQQTYLQAVWDWVAGSPTAPPGQQQGLEQEIVDLSRIEERQSIEQFAQSPTPTTPSNASVSFPSYSAFSEQREAQPTPPTQDLHLSIGSISVILETPPPPQTPPSSPPTPSRSSPSPASSRLNRHYLRL